MRPHLVNRMSWLHNRKTQFKIYKGPAAGWGALLSVTHAWLNSEQPIKNIKALLRTNQQGGFDCPGCAWGDSPESGAVKFCENGAKAVNWEATSRRVDAKFSLGTASPSCVSKVPAQRQHPN